MIVFSLSQWPLSNVILWAEFCFIVTCIILINFVWTLTHWTLLAPPLVANDPHHLLYSHCPSPPDKEMESEKGHYRFISYTFTSASITHAAHFDLHVASQWNIACKQARKASWTASGTLNKEMNTVQMVVYYVNLREYFVIGFRHEYRTWVTTTLIHFQNSSWVVCFEN